MRLFLPYDYQPKYAYPLVVLFHANGTDEDAAARLAPLLSRRNYVVACPRGPRCLSVNAGGLPGFAWAGRADRYLAEVVSHVREKYHVHPQRLFLMGIGEGAAVAYDAGLSLHGVGGVIALNGELPQSRKKPTAGLKVFVGHGVNNPLTSASVARRNARRIAAVGADVRFQTYATTERIHPEMLRDANRWIMNAISATSASWEIPPATPQL